MVIDNTDKLKDFLIFKKGGYYKFVVLQRAKDENTKLIKPEKSEFLVRQWLVSDEVQLKKLLPDMKAFADKFSARLYVCVDRKSVAKTLFSMKQTIDGYISQLFFGKENSEISVTALNKILASNSALAKNTHGDKRWLFDIDDKSGEAVNLVRELCGKHFLATLPTKNGFHIIAERKFDTAKLDFKGYKISVRANYNALIYMNLG